MQNSDGTDSRKSPKQASRVDAYGLFHLLVAGLTERVVQRLNPRIQADDGKYQQSKQEQ